MIGSYLTVTAEHFKYDFQTHLWLNLNHPQFRPVLHLLFLFRDKLSLLILVTDYGAHLQAAAQVWFSNKRHKVGCRIEFFVHTLFFLPEPHEIGILPICHTVRWGLGFSQAVYYCICALQRHAPKSQITFYKEMTSEDKCTKKLV